MYWRHIRVSIAKTLMLKHIHCFSMATSWPTVQKFGNFLFQLLVTLVGFFDFKLFLFESVKKILRFLREAG